MATKRTISALVDYSYQPADNQPLAHRIEQTEIPLAARPKDCDHDDTVCADCVPVWQHEYLFTEPLPWDSTHPTDTEP